MFREGFKTEKNLPSYIVKRNYKAGFQNNWLMNNDTFASLKSLMNNLECESDNIPDLVNEIKKKCQEALHLIDDLRFKNNSAHVQLATKQAVQYINKALFEIKAYADAYNPVNKSSTVDIKDICSPIHAGLEIILNLDYK